jgi:hypothetical protein
LREWKEKEESMGLVIAPAAATAATVRSPASVVMATTATTTVRTVTAIVPPSAIRTSAPIHPISAAGSAVPLVAEQPIAPIAFGDLIANGLCGKAPLSEILSMPFYFTSQIRQLGRTKALPHALRHHRCSVFRGNHGFLDHCQAFGATSQHVLTHSLPLLMPASRQITHLIDRSATAKCFGQRLHGSLTIPLILIDYPFCHRLLQNLSGRLEVPHHLFQYRIDSAWLHALGQSFFHLIRQRLGWKASFAGPRYLIEQLIDLFRRVTPRHTQPINCLSILRRERLCHGWKSRQPQG